MNDWNQIRDMVKAKQPLIHCITNPISINQCANAVLAVGARPIMAEHPKEVEEITATAEALLLNLGNITDVRMESMRISARTAASRKIPMVLDAVGIACSSLRRGFAYELIETYAPAVIKGNYSEIRALYQSTYQASGVDAKEPLDVNQMETIAVYLAKKYHGIILASGPVDLVTDGKKLVAVKNGTPKLAQITGTGCMLGALCSCYLSVCPNIEAVTAACVVLGLCGELAETERGTGSFQVNLMDQLSVLSEEAIKTYRKVEEREIENI